VKPPQEKIGNTQDNIGIGNNSMNRIIAQQLSKRIDKWDCMKVKCFCTAKEVVTRLKG
jgi:RNA-binding protein YhbY